MYIDPVHPGRGVGQALLAERFKDARGIGYRPMDLSLVQLGLEQRG